MQHNCIYFWNDSYSISHAELVSASHTLINYIFSDEILKQVQDDAPVLFQFLIILMPVGIADAFLFQVFVQGLG